MFNSFKNRDSLHTKDKLIIVCFIICVFIISFILSIEISNYVLFDGNDLNIESAPDSLVQWSVREDSLGNDKGISKNNPDLYGHSTPVISLSGKFKR